MTNISDTREYHRQYYQEHKKEFVEYNKAYRSKPGVKEKEKEAARKYAENHREEVNKRSKESYRKNPQARRNITLRNSFGITLDEYNEMFEARNGCCEICGRHQSHFTKALNVDHFHAKGYSKMKPDQRKRFIRGLLCGFCNRGFYKENPETLRKAAEYFERFEYMKLI
jgi:hypothetical protein